jgi:signal transduction histidine kinase
MIAIYFVYGLAFFSLGFATSLEARRASELPLGKQLPWLAAFGFAHSAVEWIDMFLLVVSSGPAHEALTVARSVLLPLSALLLVRFGSGLVGEAGPLPDWLSLLPVVLLIPAALLVAYALIVAVTESPLETAADVWSRYLLYLPGNLLASFGFTRQWRVLSGGKFSRARNLLLGAALVFVFNALVAGLIVPAAPYGLAPWLNYESLVAATHVPVQIWRMLSAVAVTFFVVRALGVFEAERAQRIADLQTERQQAQRAALQTQSEARWAAENWTQGLVGIGRRIAGMEPTDSILAAIVDLARRLLNADLVALGLWGETGDQLKLKCYATTGGIKAIDSTSVGNAIILKALTRGHAYRFPDDDQDRAYRWVCPVLGRQVQAAAIVPLHLENQPVGGLWAARVEAQPFSAADAAGLEQLADQAVIALEHASMAAQLQSLAVTEERGRIAREMHDGLAQVLGYLSLQLQTLEAYVKQNDCERALAELCQARTRIKEAQADVRESILSLRTTLSGEIGLIPALQQYVGEFGVQTGIRAELISECDELPCLSPLAEAQLVRIVQEALTNVRKHARARHTQVRLTMQHDCVSASITDDGVGINGRASQGHFGLQTMRERAESVGGGLTVSSESGAGTQVELWIPTVN